MRNAKSLLGMPVIRNGEKLGRVSYVLTDKALHSLSGLYLYCGLSGARFIDGSQIDLIGDVAVLSRDGGRRCAPNDRPLLRRALSTDGRHIGAITDALIDEQTLRIEALELSRGYLDDLFKGRMCIRQFNVQKNGDVVVESAEGGKLS